MKALWNKSLNSAVLGLIIADFWPEHLNNSLVWRRTWEEGLGQAVIPASQPEIHSGRGGLATVLFDV